MRVPTRRSAVGGYNDALGQALTFVGAPVLFGAVGWLLDRVLGTGPLLMILFGLIGAAGVLAWAYYQYQARSAAHDEGKPWTRRAW